MAKIAELRKHLGNSENLAKAKACVYVTGSFGRGEASEFSDLDLFIVGKPDPDNRNGRALRKLDEICIKAELIQTARSERFPEFTGDGQYLIHYTIDELVRSLGSPEDDATNTFTARLLLLLESKPLLENDVYRFAVSEVIAAYWRDYEDHANEFMPTFLTNDILRLWRTFCVNYEARTETDPPEKKAKRKLKNYKLKHSRLLTCYSAVAYLLALVALRKTATPQDAVKMSELTPTERLEWIAAELPKAAESIAQAIAIYEEFLRVTCAPEIELIQMFLDSSKAKNLFRNAQVFGDKIFEALKIIGDNGRFFRLLVV